MTNKESGDTTHVSTDIFIYCVFGSLGLLRPPLKPKPAVKTVMVNTITVEREEDHPIIMDHHPKETQKEEEKEARQKAQPYSHLLIRRKQKYVH